MIRRLRSGLDPYLLAILATVAVASLAPARGSAAPFFSHLADGAIAFLFFLYGARLSPRSAWDGFRSWRLHLTVFATSFVLFPLLGLACRLLEPTILTPQLYFGVMFLCILPSTVQSSIAFTSIAGGNVPAAICSASFSNLAGVVLTPVLAVIFLGSQASFSATSLLRIATQILLPFAVGQAARPIIGKIIERHRTTTGLVDRGSVLLVIYSAFSEGVVAGIWHQLSIPHLLAVALIDILILSAALGITTFVSKRLGFPLADRITIIFCGSKKSLATGIPLAAVLFVHQNTSLIVLPLMLFHQIQLMVCAVLARRFGRQTRAINPAATSKRAMLQTPGGTTA
ncbi:MAG: Bile acid:sodium symporter [Pseudonocardiales bacterium]|nr:Bile acid:sodium symporter [Pseudonocardiales bacterium]